MIAALIFALAAGASDLPMQYSREWQTCIVDTSRIWAAKPGDPDKIVDAATIRCRDKLELYLIAEEKHVKEIGLNQAQADEYLSFLAAGLLRINRTFAVEAVQKARQ